jgi:hypothetical protein
MAGLYLTTLYTGYQGLKWREVRTLGDDMKPLQQQVKELEDQIASYGEEYDTSEYAAKLAPLKAQLDEMTAKRKELVQAGYRDKHWALASVLLACGVTFSIEVRGCVSLVLSYLIPINNTLVLYKPETRNLFHRSEWLHVFSTWLSNVSMCL